MEDAGMPVWRASSSAACGFFKKNPTAQNWKSPNVSLCWAGGKALAAHDIIKNGMEMNIEMRRHPKAPTTYSGEKFLTGKGDSA